MKAPSVPKVPKPALPPTTAQARLDSRTMLSASNSMASGIRTSPGGLTAANTQSRTLLGGAA